MSATFLRRMGSLANGIYASGPDPTGAGSSSFATVQFLPAYRRQFGSAPATVFAFAAFDATNLVLEAVRRTAVQLPGGALVINREALRASIISVTGYDGLSGVLTCLPAGDCVPAARISVYRAPQWPVGGRAAALPVFSTARTLAEVTGGG
jgi:ABC-type branched-subunit amino acid transport system substrate-binding protein